MNTSSAGRRLKSKITKSFPRKPNSLTQTKSKRFARSPTSKSSTSSKMSTPRRKKCLTKSSRTATSNFQANACLCVAMNPNSATSRLILSVGLPNPTLPFATAAACVQICLRVMSEGATPWLSSRSAILCASPKLKARSFAKCWSTRLNFIPRRSAASSMSAA